MTKSDVGNFRKFDVGNFRVGDKVEILEQDNERKGKTGTVDHIQSGVIYPVNVKFDDGTEEPFTAANLKLVEDTKAEEKPEMVNHPAHYGGADNPYEVIKVAEAWGLDKDAYLFNVLKYVARAGKKGSKLEDLKKGSFYINRRIKVEEESSVPAT